MKANKIIPEDALKTFDFGSLEGKKQTKEVNDHIHNNIINNPDSKMHEEGESFNEATNRVVPKMKDILKSAPANTTVVTHNSIFGLIKLWDKENRPDGFDRDQREAYTKQDNKFGTGSHFTIQGENGPIHVVRHGQTEDNKEHLMRTSKTPLTKDGIKEAKTVGKELSKHDIPEIITSPLDRAVHTSKLILGEQSKKNFRSGGWLDNYGKDENANEGVSKGPSDMETTGVSTKGFDYNGAWGGQFQHGGKAYKDLPKYKGKSQPMLSQDDPSSEGRRQYDKQKQINKEALKSGLKTADVATDIMQLGNFVPHPIGQAIGQVGNWAGGAIDAYQAGESAYKGDYTGAALNLGSLALPVGLKKAGTYTRAIANAQPGSWAEAIGNIGGKISNKGGKYVPLTQLKKHIGPVTAKAINFNRGLLGGLGAETAIDASQKEHGGWLDSFQDGGDVDMYGSPITAKSKYDSSVNRTNYDPRTNQMIFGNDFEKLSPSDKEKTLAHENRHAWQFGNDRTNFDIVHNADTAFQSSLQKKPQMMTTNEVYENYHNRKQKEVDADLKSFKELNPELSLMRDDLIYKMFIDNAQYKNPNSVEGEAEYYQNTGKQFQMGGSMPGSVGFTYARTKGIPSNGPDAKKTLPSAQKGFKLKDERDQAYRPAESTSVKKIDSIADLRRKTQAENKAVSDYRKLTPEQKARMEYNNQIEQRGNISKHVPQSTFDKTKEVIMNPLTAAQYAINKQHLPDRFTYGPTNALDYPLGLLNVPGDIAAMSGVPGELAEGNFMEAGLNALGSLEHLPNAGKLLKSGVEGVKNIKTGIAPELRQGLRTAGPSLGESAAREVPTLPEGYSFRPDKNRYFLQHGNKDIGHVEYFSPTEDIVGNKWGAIDIEIDPRYRGKGLSAPMYQKILEHSKAQGHKGIMSVDQSLQSPAQSQAIRKYFPGQYSEDPNIIKHLGEITAEDNKFIQEDNLLYGENEPLTEAPTNAWLMSHTKFQQGGIIDDDMGQWAHPGKITRINSNNITMRGVNYPVLGVSDTGDKKLMKPGKNYQFKGNKVTEFPRGKSGGNVRQEQKGKVNLDQLTNFTNYNTKQPGGWLDNL